MRCHRKSNQVVSPKVGKFFDPVLKLVLENYPFSCLSQLRSPHCMIDYFLCEQHCGEVIDDNACFNNYILYGLLLLSSAFPSHLNRKCSSFSTSPMVHYI